MWSFALSMNNMKRSGAGLEIGTGLSFYSKLYLFNYLKTYEILLYSKELHYSGRSPLHYTFFSFCEDSEGPILQQQWSLHVNDNRLSSCINSTKWHVHWDEITYQFVHNSFIFLYFILTLFFFQGSTFY